MFSSPIVPSAQKYYRTETVFCIYLISCNSLHDQKIFPDVFHVIKAFSPKKGLVFAVNGASAPLPPPHPRPLAPAPPPFPRGAVGVLLKIPGGGAPPGEGGGRGGKGQGCVRGIWGGGLCRGRRGPIYRENEPLFRRKRLNCIFAGWNPGILPARTNYMT